MNLRQAINQRFVGEYHSLDPKMVEKGFLFVCKVCGDATRTTHTIYSPRGSGSVRLCDKCWSRVPVQIRESIMKGDIDADATTCGHCNHTARGEKFFEFDQEWMNYRFRCPNCGEPKEPNHV